MFARSETVLLLVLFCFSFDRMIQTVIALKHQKNVNNYIQDNQDYEPLDTSYDSSRAVYYGGSASGKTEREYKLIRIQYQVQ